MTSPGSNYQSLGKVLSVVLKKLKISWRSLPLTHLPDAYRPDLKLLKNPSHVLEGERGRYRWAPPFPRMSINWFHVQKVVSRHKTVEENEYRDPQLWKAARDVVDAVGVDGMSGEDTDGEPPGREKRLLRVPVKWINPELTGLFHIIDTWKSAVQDESFSTPRGNRPLTRLATSKVPVEGHATKGLPRNWYDETWYKSQSDPKKILLNTLPPRPIPCIVSLICFVFQISSLTIIFSNLASNRVLHLTLTWVSLFAVIHTSWLRNWLFLRSPIFPPMQWVASIPFVHVPFLSF
jgi:hypothetical protein